MARAVHESLGPGRRAGTGGDGMETKESVRYWAGVVGAVAVVAGILAVVVMVRMPGPKKTPATQAKTTPQTQAAARTQTSPPKAQAPAKAQPQPVAKAQPQPPPKAAALTEAERKASEELYIEQKKLDTDGARATATPEGRRRVGEMIAKQFNVPDKLVNDLRSRKISWGEITAALALSQQLMKRDKVTRQQALDTVLAARKSGQGWAALSRGLGLKVADVLSEVKKTDKQVSKLATLKASR